jgi:heterodisulfide reductase subunit C2
MSHSSHASDHATGLAHQVREATGESAFRCYQCGKCSAGCPLAEEMDVPPSQILRLLQVGLPDMEKEALLAYSIWVCLTCETCAARCPQEVDIPRVMEYLRQESLRRGTMHPRAKDILAFHRSLLDSVRRSGRLHEVSLIAAYKLRTGHLFQDVMAAPGMLARGKLSLLPHSIDGKQEVARIFERTAEGKADHT